MLFILHMMKIFGQTNISRITTKLSPKITSKFT